MPVFGMSFFGASTVGGTTVLPQPVELYPLLQQPPQEKQQLPQEKLQQLPQEKQEKQLFSLLQQLDRQQLPQQSPQPLF